MKFPLFGRTPILAILPIPFEGHKLKGFHLQGASSSDLLTRGPALRPRYRLSLPYCFRAHDLRSFEKWQAPFDSPHRVLFVFHCNYGPIAYRFRDIERYWSKIAIFL